MSRVDSIIISNLIHLCCFSSMFLLLCDTVLDKAATENGWTDVSAAPPHLFWRSHSVERTRPPGGRSLTRIWSAGRTQTKWSALGRCCCSVDPKHRRCPRCRRGSRWSHTCAATKRYYYSQVWQRFPAVGFLLVTMQKEGIKRRKEIKVQRR